MLWENQSSSIFGPQTIGVPSLSNYSLLYLEFYNRFGDGGSSPFANSKSNVILSTGIADLITFPAVNEVICWRNCQVNKNDNSITFTNAYWVQSYNNWTINILNSLAVPYRIYGIK